LAHCHAPHRSGAWQCAFALIRLHRSHNGINCRIASLRALANMHDAVIVVQTTDPAAFAAASSRQRTR
jgi:hypothetical protein